MDQLHVSKFRKSSVWVMLNYGTSYLPSYLGIPMLPSQDINTKVKKRLSWGQEVSCYGEDWL